MPSLKRQNRIDKVNSSSEERSSANATNYSILSNFDETLSPDKDSRDKNEMVNNKQIKKPVTNSVKHKIIENSDSEWQTCQKKKNYKDRINKQIGENKGRFSKPTSPVITNKSVEKVIDTTIPIPTDNGAKYELQNNWFIWTHLIVSDDWSPNSYKKLYTINNLHNFWGIFWKFG